MADEDFSYLPGALAEIASVAGLVAALAIAEKWGGARAYFPARVSEGHWLVDLVGRERRQAWARFRRDGRIDPAIERRPVGGLDLTVMNARVLPGPRGDFGGEQAKNQAVLVGGPNSAVAAQEARPGAFFTSETNRGVEQARGKPLEAHGHFAELAT